MCGWSMSDERVCPYCKGPVRSGTKCPKCAWKWQYCSKASKHTTLDNNRFNGSSQSVPVSLDQSTTTVTASTSALPTTSAGLHSAAAHEMESNTPTTTGSSIAPEDEAMETWDSTRLPAKLERELALCSRASRGIMQFCRNLIHQNTITYCWFVK